VASVRYGVPQNQRALDVGEGLGQAEDRLGLIGRVHRGDQRLARSAGDGPVAREFGRRRGRAAGELVGDSGVQILALAGKDRRIDRLGQQGVAEAERAAGLLRHEKAVLDRLP